MIGIYKCPNEECWWNDFGQKGDYCPECGAELQKFGFRKGNKLAQAKKKSLSAKAKKADDKTKRQEEKQKQQKEKQKEQETILESYKKSISGAKGGNPVTLILEKDGIRLERKGFWTGRDKGFEEIKYENITNIGIEKGFVGATVEIKYRGGKFELPNIVKEHAEIFVNSAREKVRSTSTPKTESTISPMYEIKKAKELLDMGAITQEEFDKVKKKYL